MASNNEWTRVVVLTPPPTSATASSCGISAPLKSLFAARDWFAVEQHDPYQAMAELCLREKAQAARSGWGLQRLEKLALTIVQPNHWPTLDGLLDAVRQYVPSATIWQATDDDVLPLETAPPKPQSTARNGHVPANARQSPSKPTSPPQDEPVLTSPTKSKPKSEKSAALTREEIDMLLTADLAGPEAVA